MKTLHYIINYTSYILLLTPFLLIYLSIREKVWKRKSILPKILIIILILINLIGIYARVVEPNIVLVKENKIDVGFKAKIVLIADPHIGVYNSPDFLKKVVRKINEIPDVDFVVIAGDLTYVPKGDLTKLLSPLKDIKYPTYTILGNHDVGSPPPDMRKEIRAAFKDLDMPLLENDTVYLEKENITLVGLKDLWVEKDKFSFLNELKEEQNVVVIAHNPDSVYEYRKNNIDLTLSGHTHGGQIRIPFVYQHFIPTKHSFNQGFYIKKNHKVFVTSGLGMTGLPFRFGIPPKIDIIQLY